MLSVAVLSVVVLSVAVLSREGAVLPVFRFLPVCVAHGSKNRFVLKKKKNPKNRFLQGT